MTVNLHRRALGVRLCHSSSDSLLKAGEHDLLLTLELGTLYSEK